LKIDHQQQITKPKAIHDDLHTTQYTTKRKLQPDEAGPHHVENVKSKKLKEKRFSTPWNTFRMRWEEQSVQ
jgi:hypothetical protein